MNPIILDRGDGSGVNDSLSVQDQRTEMSTSKKSDLVKTVLADGRIELSGATFHLREEIKASGGKWDPSRKVWVLPMGSVLPLVVRPRDEWTREEWQTWSCAFTIRNGGRVERCCSAARHAGNLYGPMEYICDRHGVTKGTFRGD